MGLGRIRDRAPATVQVREEAAHVLGDEADCAVAKQRKVRVAVADPEAPFDREAGARQRMGVKLGHGDALGEVGRADDNGRLVSARCARSQAVTPLGEEFRRHRRGRCPEKDAAIELGEALGCEFRAQGVDARGEVLAVRRPQLVAQDRRDTLGWLGMAVILEQNEVAGEQTWIGGEEHADLNLSGFERFDGARAARIGDAKFLEGQAVSRARSSGRQSSSVGHSGPEPNTKFLAGITSGSGLYGSSLSLSKTRRLAPCGSCSKLKTPFGCSVGPARTAPPAATAAAPVSAMSVTTK